MSRRPNPKTFMYLALVTVAAGGGLCFWQYSKLKEIDVRVNTLRTEVSDPRAVQAHLDDSIAKLNASKQSLQHLEANVSDVAYVPSLLHDLDAFGKANGISVTGVRPTPKPTGSPVDAKTQAAKPYDELTITVTGTGDWASIERFVDNLPNFPKIVAARMISIEPSNQTKIANAPDGSLNLTLDLKAYVFKTDPNAQPATPSVGKNAPGTGRTAILNPAKPAAFGSGRNQIEG